MVDIHLRGELWDNDSSDVLRFHGWRDITAPMDIQAALEAAGASIAKKHGSGSEKSICNFVKKGVYSFEEKIN